MGYIINKDVLEDYYLLDPENISSFYNRNFNRNIKKPGIDLYPIIAVI